MKNKLLALPILVILILTGIFVVKPKLHRSSQPQPSPTPESQSAPTEEVPSIVVPSTLSIFSSKIFLKRDKTLIIIPIRFNKNIEQAWLHLNSKGNNKPWKWLIAHPRLMELKWPSLEENTFYLYQRQPVYNSIAAFLAKPPAPEKLLIDDAVAKFPKYSPLKGTPLSYETNVADYDFVFTTYKPSNTRDLTIYYSNLVDAGNAVVQDENITWQIEVETASQDNPYYLGNIHIDYRQY